MNISEFSILVGGILSFALVIFHTRFYVLFGWKDDFEKVQRKNKNILYTIHMALILLFVIFTIISFVYMKELAAASGLAFGICLLYSLFWLWRAIWQVAYFKFPADAKKSALHYILILVCLLLFISYLVPVIMKL
jgi:hypothetical protein